MAQNTKIKGYNEYGGKIIKEKSTYNLPFKIFIATYRLQKVGGFVVLKMIITRCYIIIIYYIIINNYLGMIIIIQYIR